MVIFVLTYYLPQHQHHAPGVLANRSLALLGLSSPDQLILFEVRYSGSWQPTLALPQRLVGWHRQYSPCHASSITERH